MLSAQKILVILMPYSAFEVCNFGFLLASEAKTLVKANKDALAKVSQLLWKTQEISISIVGVLLTSFAYAILFSILITNAVVTLVHSCYVKQVLYGRAARP